MTDVPRTLADPVFHPARMVEYSRALVTALPEATVMILDAHETVWVAEGRLLERNGEPLSALVGRPMAEFLPPSRRAMLTERYRAALRGGVQSFDYSTDDGRRCWIQLTPMYFGEPAPAAVIVVIQDVTQRQTLTAELQSERERRQAAEELAGLGYWEVDPGTGSVSLSEGSLRLLGTRESPDINLDHLLDQFEAADRPRLLGALAEALDRGVAEFECDLHALDGARRRVLLRGTRTVTGDGRTVVTGTTIDITALRTAERARAESEAMFRQGFDGSPIGMGLTHPITGRYLRVNDALCRLLDRGREDLLQMSFMQVTHPEHGAADEEAWDLMSARTVAHHVREKRYVRPDGSAVWVSVHTSPVFHADGEIGGYFSQIIDLTERKEREEQLMRDASDLERLQVLRAALDDDRLVLHAQPIVDVATGAVIQQELLVRLRGEDGVLLPPAEFLPVAERYGTIREIDQWVTQRAAELAAAGAPVEVNLSAASVGDEDMLSAIREALERTGADPALIVFEVTETALMADIDRGRAFASAVRELGCRFALDDFGTGYGTFTYLKHIPVDYLKIDIEFVRDLLKSEDDERLVRTIVSMARDFGKITIAEGVEDAATLDRLRELGVDHAQGYHIGRPAEIELAPRAAPSVALRSR